MFYMHSIDIGGYWVNFNSKFLMLQCKPWQVVSGGYKAIGTQKKLDNANTVL